MCERDSFVLVQEYLLLAELKLLCSILWQNGYPDSRDTHSDQSAYMSWAWRQRAIATTLLIWYFIYVVFYILILVAARSKNSPLAKVALHRWTGPKRSQMGCPWLGQLGMSRLCRRSYCYSYRSYCCNGQKDHCNCFCLCHLLPTCCWKLINI